MQIKVANIFAAVSDKSILDPLLESEKARDQNINFWGTDGTVKYLKSKGFSAQSIVSGFDFEGRVKTLDRNVFTRILADRKRLRHQRKMRKLKLKPFDLVVVELYPPNKKNFPESMDIGGQALIRAAIKNYKNVALAFDKSSLASLVDELIRNSGTTSLSFRKKQAVAALKFIADRSKLEMNYEL